jgi:hypothetical protein
MPERCLGAMDLLPFVNHWQAPSPDRYLVAWQLKCRRQNRWVPVPDEAVKPLSGCW